MSCIPYQFCVSQEKIVIVVQNFTSNTLGRDHLCRIFFTVLSLWRKKPDIQWRCQIRCNIGDCRPRPQICRASEEQRPSTQDDSTASKILDKFPFLGQGPGSLVLFLLWAGFVGMSQAPKDITNFAANTACRLNPVSGILRCGFNLNWAHKCWNYWSTINKGKFWFDNCHTRHQRSFSHRLMALQILARF